jgi:hypothetical protein
VCRKFLEKKGAKDPYQYGETPYETALKICNELKVTEKDIFHDLGSGRGLLAFYVEAITKCKVIGIEEIPIFVNLANFTSKILRLNARFLKDSYLNCSFDDESVIYLYGTMLEDHEIISLCKRFTSSQKIISISYPLSDYDEAFKTLKTFEVSYPWGKTEAYVNQR